MRINPADTHAAWFGTDQAPYKAQFLTLQSVEVDGERRNWLSGPQSPEWLNDVHSSWWLTKEVALRSIRTIRDAYPGIIQGHIDRYTANLEAPEVAVVEGSDQSRRKLEQAKARYERLAAELESFMGQSVPVADLARVASQLLNAEREVKRWSAPVQNVPVREAASKVTERLQEALVRKREVMVAADLLGLVWARYQTRGTWQWIRLTETEPIYMYDWWKK